MAIKKDINSNNMVAHRYVIDLGDDNFVPVSIELQKTIVRDYLMKYYHWTLATAALLIGFLVGVIAGG